MVSFPRPLILCLALMTIGVATGAALAQPGLTRHYTFEGDFEPAGGFDWELPGRYWTPTLRASGVMPETTSEGVLGRAIAFDGVDDQLLASTALTLDTSAGTIAHWLRPTATGAQVAFYTSDFPDGPLDYNGFGSAGVALEMHTGIIDGQWRFEYQDGDGSGGANTGGRYRVQGGTVAVDRWTHVAVTWDRSGSLLLYENCRLVASQSLGGASWDGRTAAETYVGRPSDVGAGRRFAGSVDDLRLYDRALSEAEIQKAFCRALTSADQVLEGASSGAKMVSDGEHLFYGDLSWARRLADGTWESQPDVVLPVDPDATLSSIAFDGTTLVALRRRFPAETLRLDLFEWSGSSWSLSQSILDLGVLADTGNVDLAGDWLAVGRRHTTDSSVLLYRKVGGSWSAAGTLEVPGTKDRFAWSIALDGDRLAVVERGTVDAGQAHFYERADSVWTPDGVVSLDDAAFGGATLVGEIAMEGDLAVVSHPDAIVDGLNSGGVNVIERGAGVWSKGPLLTPPDGTFEGRFGRRVSVAGERIAIQNATSSVQFLFASEAPRLYVFERQASGELDLARSMTETGPGQRLEYLFEMVLTDQEVVVGGLEDFGPGYELFIYRLPFFADGFESSDLSGWSAVSP